MQSEMVTVKSYQKIVFVPTSIDAERQRTKNLYTIYSLQMNSQL